MVLRCGNTAILKKAIDCEYAFGEDLLGGGIAGFSLTELKQYLRRSIIYFLRTTTTASIQKRVSFQKIFSHNPIHLQILAISLVFSFACLL